MAAPQITEALKYRINIKKGPIAGQKFELETLNLKIGRGNENGLVLANDLKASRLHAEIRWDGFELHIHNLSSKNFLIVNGAKVDKAKLDSGAVVHIGDSEFVIEYDQEEKTKFFTAEPVVQATKAVLRKEEPFPQFDANEVSVEMRSNPILQAVAPAPMSTAIRGGGMMGGAGTAHPNYSSNVPGASASKRGRQKPRKLNTGSNSGRIRFYAIVAVVGLAGWWLMSPNAKKKDLTFRSTEQIEQEIEASRDEIKEFEVRKEKMGNLQYKRAQENYIRGFRDYRQGNYGRARESFQVVLNLDPDNELAKRYYHMAKVKFDELVKFHMLQGNRYREKKNWRMCKASYFNTMTMLNNGQDPVFKEAKQYYDQCSLAEEGHF